MGGVLLGQTVMVTEVPGATESPHRQSGPKQNWAGPQRLHHRLSGPVLWLNWTRPAGRRVMLGTLEQWTLKVCVRLPARPAVPRAVPFTTSPHRSLRTSRLTAG